MDREKSIADRFAKTVKAALTTEEHDEMPTVPGTVAPPLVSKQRKARSSGCGTAGKKKTANKLARKKKRPRSPIDRLQKGGLDWIFDPIFTRANSARSQSRIFCSPAPMK